MTERDAKGVFGVLHILEHIAGPVYRHGGGCRHDLRVVKACNYFAQRIRLDERIGIKATDEVCACLRNAGVQRRMLPAVFFAHDAHLRMPREALHLRRRRVGRTVVDQNNLQLFFRIIQRKERIAGRGDRRGLVPAGHDNGDGRKCFASRPRARRARGLGEQGNQHERLEEYRDEKKRVGQHFRTHDGVTVA